MTDEQDESAARARRTMIAKAVVAAALGLLGLWIISGFLRALVWATVIAIAIDPLYDRALRGRQTRRHRYTIAALVTVAVALVLLVPIAMGIWGATYDADAVIDWIAYAQVHGIAVPQFVPHLPFIGHTLAAWWEHNLASPESARHQLDHIDTASWLLRSQAIGAGLLHRAVTFAFTLIGLFFLLRDRDTVTRQCRIAVHRLLGEASERILRQTVLSVRGTIDGLVLVGLGEGAVMTVAYYALGVPHELLLGALTAVAAIFPFGAALMFAVAAALLVAKGLVASAVMVVVVGLIVVGIADHFIRPAMIGSATQLPFLWVLVGILGGVETLGLLGLFVGPATMAVLFMLWREYVQGGGTPETNADSVS